MLKKHPKSSPQFANFSVMLLTENQLFGSSAGSDLQAINYLKYHTLMIKIEAYYCDDRVFYEILKTSNANLETNSKVIVSNLFKKFMSD